MDKIGKKNILKLSIICVVIVSIALFIPQIREIIIQFGEKLLGRTINHGFWSKRIICATLSFDFALCLFFVFLKKVHFISPITLLLFLINCILIVFLFAGGFGGWGDFDGHHTICAYVLKGVNPFPLEGVQTPYIQELGTIPNGWATVPWGLVLENIFYTGFLSLRTSHLYFILLTFFTIVFLEYEIFKALKSESKQFRIEAMLLTLTSYQFWVALHHNGNCGGIICCFIIIACLRSDKNPLFTGILLGIAMTKPQISALICVSFLLQKRWKAIAVAALLDIFAWIVSAMLTKTNPLTLLEEFFASNVGGGNQFNGILTLAGSLFPNARLTMAFSMAIGIALVIAFHFSLHKTPLPFFRFYPACIIATFWSYTFWNDNFIMLIPILTCLYVMLSANKFQEKLIFSLALSYCIFQYHIEKTAGTFIRLFFHKGKEISWQLSFHEQITAYSLGLIAVSVIILIKLNRNEDSPRI